MMSTRLTSTIEHGPGFWLSVRLLAFVLCLSCGISHSQTNRRVALLIGNGGYSGTMPSLTYPNRDVAALEPALKRLGFEVQTVRDADQKTMSRAIRDFGSAAQNAQLAFVYYSGHGMQARDENYLIPVGAQIETEADLDIEAVQLRSLMRQIEEARPAATVVVLDACRDNPVAGRNKSGVKGLSRVQNPPSNTLVVFAALPGTVASDNGVLAQELARQMASPNQGIRTVFDKVGQAVRRATGNRQVLQREDQLTEDLVLSPNQLSVAQLPTAPTQAGPTAQHDENQAWLDIMASPQPWKFLQYQLQFPRGRFGEEARRRAGIAVATRGGCALREQSAPAPDSDIEWSGACTDGLAHGAGTKTYVRSGVPTLAWSARFERGIPVGRWTGEFLQPGELKQVEIQFDASGDVLRRQKFVFSSGASYDGETDSNVGRPLGRPHGSGLLRYADGGEYQGSFVDGRREGSGALRFPTREATNSAVRYVVSRIAVMEPGMFGVMEPVSDCRTGLPKGLKDGIILPLLRWWI